MARGIFAQEVHEAGGLDVVVLQKGLDGVFVLFAAHVLVGAEIGHDVKAFLFPEDAGENGVGEVEGIRAVHFRHLDAVRGAQVPREFGQAVLAEVHYREGRGAEFHQFPDKGAADGAGAANDTYLLPADFPADFLFMLHHVPGEEALLPSGDVFRNESLSVEHACVLC